MTTLTDRMSVRFVLDRRPTIGRIIEHGHSGCFGPSFTSQREIIANSQPLSDMVVVTFMRGFREPCKWNDSHGQRGPTDEERAMAQAWLDKRMAQYSES